MGRTRALLIAAFAAMALLTTSVGLVHASAEPSRAGPLVRLISSAAHLPAGAVKLNALPGDQRIAFSFVFKPAHQHDLDLLLRDLHDPRSPRYEHWLPTDAFVHEFGPTAAQARALNAWLRLSGITDVHQDGMTVRAEARAMSVGRALGVAFDRVSFDDTTGYVASNAPLVPRELEGAIAGVIGLSDNLRFDSAAVATASGVRSRSASPRTAAPRTGTACPAAVSHARLGFGSMTADAVGRAYGVDDLFANGLNGKGRTIAIISLAKSRASDIAKYFKCFGLHNRVTVVPVDSKASVSPGTLEADLDIQDVATHAPAARILSYEASNTESGTLGAYRQAVNDNRAQIISTSWGLCEARLLAAHGEAYTTALHELFEQATAQGQSVFAATGDSGSEACYKPDDASPDEALEVVSPADDPLVTAVGGTVLQGRFEGVWNVCAFERGDECAHDFGHRAGGGGQSKIFKRPPWQRVGAYATCRSCRQMPDISANADAQLFYDQDTAGDWDNTGWVQVTGTSISTPTVAGIAADIAQGARSGRLGDFAQKLTALAALHTYGSAITDINASYDGNDWTKPGSIDWTGTNRGQFRTAPGYDLASGYGSPIALGLVCPEVFSVVPDHQTPGQRVKIRGIGLEKARILFGNSPARVLASGTTSASVLVPKGSGAVKVHAVDPMCTSPLSAPFRIG